MFTIFFQKECFHFALYLWRAPNLIPFFRHLHFGYTNLLLLEYSHVLSFFVYVWPWNLTIITSNKGQRTPSGDCCLIISYIRVSQLLKAFQTVKRVVRKKGMEEIPNESLEYTPTWIVAVICSIIVFISLCVERALHKLGLVSLIIMIYIEFIWNFWFVLCIILSYLLICM